MKYRVTWEIDIDADSPEEAAKEAYRIQKRKESIATIFDIEGREIDVLPLLCPYCWNIETELSPCAEGYRQCNTCGMEWLQE